MKKRNIFKIFFILILFLLILTITKADLYCYVAQGNCVSSTSLLRFENDSSGMNNSHAQFYNYTQDPYTKLLLHMDGTNASTTFTDSAAGGSHTWTVNGNAKIITDYYKFATGSGLFDGKDDYLSTSDSDDWNFGNNNFTIDAWIRINNLNSLTTRGANQTNFSYTGGQQTFTVPSGVTYVMVEIRGAQGADGTSSYGNGGTGGTGGLVTTNISVNSGETLYIYVGGTGSTYIAGYNGGGTGGSYSSYYGGGGGGASDIRRAGTNLGNRVAVAGGGGGGGGGSASGAGGTGGYNNGQTGNAGVNGGGTYYGGGGGGGTQSDGGVGGVGGGAYGEYGHSGSSGSGGNGGGNYGYGGQGGGGGSGYYGGGGGGEGGYANDGGGGGGGGSSWTNGTNITYTGNSRSGNGLITITYFKAILPLNCTIVSQFSNSSKAWSFGLTNQTLYFKYSTNGTNQSIRTAPYNFSNNSWYHVAVTRNDNNLRLFVNGTQIGTTQNLIGVTIFNSNDPLLIAAENLSNYTNFFNGTIDELRISKGITRWIDNFTLPTSAYTSTGNYSYTLCCNSTLYTLQNYCTNGTIFLRLENETNSHIQYPSYTSYNYPVCFNTTTSINCTAYDTTCHAEATCLLSMSNAADNRTNAHVAACNYYATNICCGGLNTPPTIPVLLAPLYDTRTINVTPTFYWQNSTDVDGDTRTYHLQVDDNSDFTSPNVNISTAEGVYNTSYTIVNPLTIGTYFWRVRAYDSADYSNWSSVWNFTLDSINILLINNTVNFNTLQIGVSNDTTTNNPTPFVIQNDGNVNVNVSVYALDDLWSNAALNTSYFQFKVDNFTSENNSFKWALLQWTNVSNSATVAIGNLSYSDSNDSAEVDIKITTPFGELIGAKGSTLTFESSYSDPP